MRARVLLPIIPSLKPKVEVALLDGGYSPLAIYLSTLPHTHTIVPGKEEKGFFEVFPFGWVQDWARGWVLQKPPKV